MPRLDISDQDAPMLREILDSTRSELRYEISNTDSKDFRDQLRVKQDLLERLLAQLADA
jgi:hypothetical protein